MAGRRGRSVGGAPPGPPPGRRRRRGRAGAAAGPGHRPLGQLVEPGAVRPAHLPAVGAGDRPRPPPRPLRRLADLPSDLPLREPLEPRRCAWPSCWSIGAGGRCRSGRACAGQLFCLYVLGYGVGRLWVEALRSDEASAPGTAPGEHLGQPGRHRRAGSWAWSCRAGGRRRRQAGRRRHPSSATTASLKAGQASTAQGPKPASVSTTQPVPATGSTQQKVPARPKWPNVRAELARAGPVRRLVAADLEAEAPGVRVLRPEAGQDAGELREDRRRRLGQRRRVDERGLEQLEGHPAEVGGAGVRPVGGGGAGGQRRGGRGRAARRPLRGGRSPRRGRAASCRWRPSTSKPAFE